jgi:hypothetical protein
MQIAIHKVSYPKQATETDLTYFFTTATMDNSGDMSWQLTYSRSAANSNLDDYNINVEDITSNFLVQISMLDVIDIADWICVGQIALTDTELFSLSMTRA